MTPPAPPVLASGQAHLFLARPETVVASAPGGDPWLSRDERSKGARFRREGHALRFRATRLLVRGILARYLGADPAALEFGEGPHGRPGLLPPPPDLDFNASRSTDWVVLVVARGARAGVDVEDLRRGGDLDAIAAHRFAPAECQALAPLPEAERRRRFFDFWTLKEAYLKARGTGLTLPLDRLWFELGPKGPPRVHLEPGLDDVPAGWHFTLHSPDRDSRVAVALHAAHPPSLSLFGDDATGEALRAVR